MFVPHTPFSTLKQKLQAVEDSLKFSGRIKVVETVGPTVGDRLVNKDPWGKDCGRPQCMMCKTSPGKCTKKNIVYKYTCDLCKEQGKIGAYIGESSRTGFDRGAEHGAALRKMDVNSPLVEHHLEEHEGQTPSFTMELVQRFVRPLERQVMEGVLIQEFQGDFPPNFTTAF